MTTTDFTALTVGTGTNRALIAFIDSPGYRAERITEWEYRLLPKRKSKGWRKHVRRKKAAHP